jgi:hypothetical protein
MGYVVFIAMFSPRIVFAQVATVPLTNAHAHNDYLHPHPLFDALKEGFCSIEADIYLRRGILMVAHVPWQIRRKRTLENLYLKPLDSIVRANGGKVYPNGPAVALWVDFKEGPARLYPHLVALLQKYDHLFARYTITETRPGPLYIVLTGNRPNQSRIEADSSWYCIADTQVKRMPRPSSPVFDKPVLNFPFRAVFGHFNRRWGWNPLQQYKLYKLMERADETGTKVRVYEMPEDPRIWMLLNEAGVSFISTDDLKGLRRFLVPLKGL